MAKPAIVINPYRKSSTWQWTDPDAAIRPKASKQPFQWDVLAFWVMVLLIGAVVWGLAAVEFWRLCEEIGNKLAGLLP